MKRWARFPAAAPHSSAGRTKGFVLYSVYYLFFILYIIICSVYYWLVPQARQEKIFMSSPACADGYNTPAQQREDSTTFMTRSFLLLFSKVHQVKTGTRPLALYRLQKNMKKSIFWMYCWKNPSKLSCNLKSKLEPRAILQIEFKL